MYDGDPKSIWHGFEAPAMLRNIEEVDDVGDMTAALFGADAGAATADADADAAAGGADDDTTAEELTAQEEAAAEAEGI